jgi:hypothetical protein
MEILVRESCVWGVVKFEIVYYTQKVEISVRESCVLCRCGTMRTLDPNTDDGKEKKCFEQRLKVFLTSLLII